MAATGKTPILLYGSTTATNTPSAGNLTNSSDGCEIAINVADKNLFFKDSTNAVNTVPIRQSSASSNGWLSSTDWSTFNSKQPAGTYVTSVTGTAPVVSSGGTTPAISMAAATGSVNGYLTSTDWTTFNGKQAALVSGSNIKTVSGTSLLGSGDLGTIGVGYGGTGTATTFTAGSVVFAGASGVYSQDNANLFWDDTNNRLGIGVATPAKTLHIQNGAVAGAARGGATTKYLFETNGNQYFELQAAATSTTNDIIFTQGSTGAYGIVGYDNTNNELKFYANSSKKMGISSAGDVTVSVGNLVIGTSGKGIDFSATAGTGTSELLADYEEGTWDPVLSDGTNNATMSASTAGSYTKIGNTVFYRARVRLTSLGSVSGSIRVTGLPYTVTNNNSNYGGGSTAAYGGSLNLTAGVSVSQIPVATTAYIGLYTWDSTAGCTAMQATEFTASGDLYISGQYYV